MWLEQVSGRRIGASLRRRMAAFKADRGGNFAIMAGLAAIPLVLVIGGGVDYSNAWRTKAEVQAAADAAVLVAAKYVGTDAAERERLADMYFAANVSDDVTIDTSGTNVTIVNNQYHYNVDFSVETPFLNLMSVSSLDMAVEAVSAHANIPLDIALVLDSSGSMAWDNRMTELKAAVKLFLDSFNTGDATVQVALIPFDTQVKLDTVTMATYAGDVANPYATTDCTTISDPTDKAACVAAQAVTDPVVDCSRLFNADWLDVQACRPNRNGFVFDTSEDWGVCGWGCTYHYYSAYQSGANFVVDRWNMDWRCWGWNCKWEKVGSPTRIYSAAMPIAVGTAVAAKDNTNTSANNDLILQESETWSGCIVDRTQPYDVQNDPPQNGTPDTLYPKSNCAINTLLPVQPLTTNLAAMKTKVDLMQPSGNTNITIGVQWGMEALTGTYPLAGASTESRAKRIMIVLTDGNNTQNRWHGSSNSAQINARTSLACSNAKAMTANDGSALELFTIRLIDGNEALLKACATDDGHYFPVTTASELTSVFQDIAEQVKRIRIVS
ncbi:VWA domain-containing protein [Jiella marina]|uniref:VWA domain-containing protein n=1 Tax=Jiella sp. LLJ827 TaxID=2917712 RepID=UPI0021015D2A|nr:VWA domain-containing protein [Jiella sp. LLJ827]MCQ0988117.1 VWA domain-containing protein [Jiella sp. LLJ827]